MSTPEGVAEPTEEQEVPRRSSDVSDGEAQPGAKVAPAATRWLPAWLRGAQGVAIAYEAIILASLLGLCLTVRLLWLERIEISEDTTFKWHFVRQWFHNNQFGDVPWTHHMARFGMNVPVYLVQLLGSANPKNYYVVPLASFALQVLLVYCAGRRLGSRAGGVFGAVLLSVFTGVNRDVSQLLPDGMSGTAAILTFYLIVRYHDALDAQRTRWLLCAAAAFVWGYLVKESNVFLLPGMLIAVWLRKRSYRDALLFAGITLLAFVLETAAFRAFTIHSSRFAIVHEGGVPKAVTFLGIFDRYVKLEPPWQMMFWLWVPTMLGMLPTKDNRVRALLVITVSFVLFLTFLVRSIDPLILWTTFRSRYFNVVLPLMVLTMGLFSAGTVQRALATSPPAWLVSIGHLSRFGPAFVFTLCAALGLLVYWLQRPQLAQHPLPEVTAISRVVNDAFRRNLPIVQEYKTERLEEARARGLKAIYSLYLKDKYIAHSDLAKNGRLPDILEAVRHDKPSKKTSYAYLLRDRSSYARGQVRELDKAGCVVRVEIITRRFFTVPLQLLPANCQAPGGGALPP